MDIKPALKDFLDDASGLYSLPEVVVRLNEVVDNPSSTVADITAVITQDPSLTLRLLQLANSPYYGLAREVDTVSQAVVLLGASRIRDMVLATAVTRRLVGIEMQHISLEEFWRHAIYTAMLARELAHHCVRGREETMFIGGLIHDIGQLLMYHQIPELAHQAYLHSLDGRGELAPVDAEREILGFDHAELGGALVARWHLPALLEECLRHHHAPGHAQRYPLEVSVVHIANSLAHLAEIDSRDFRDAPPIEPMAWHRTGLREELADAFIVRAQQQVVAVEDMLMRQVES